MTPGCRGAAFRGTIVGSTSPAESTPGKAWETWNSNGTFASGYAPEADQHSYIPMFPYYELLQSNGPCTGCNENKKDLTNLNDPGVMRAYFANFALLMKRLGTASYDGVKGFGKPAIVNVEPDFAGGYAVQAVNNGVCFNFCTGKGNDPAFLKAVVGSSGKEVGTFMSKTGAHEMLFNDPLDRDAGQYRSQYSQNHSARLS